jgi:hypothetical protein
MCVAHSLPPPLISRPSGLAPCASGSCAVRVLRPSGPALFGLALFGLALFGLALFGLALFGLAPFGLAPFGLAPFAVLVCRSMLLLA